MMTEKTSFTVMTMNLRFGLARDGENAWAHRRVPVATFLSRTRADFIGFQEVNRFQADFLSMALSDYHHIGYYNLIRPWWQSNPVYYKKDWTCLGHRHFFLSHFPDIPSKLEGSRWPRQCVVGWFEKEGMQVLVANTHFDFSPDVQARSAGLITGFLERFLAGLPTVITGDFNSEHGSPAFAAFKADGFGEVFEERPLGTFHGFTGKADRHIDWLLFRGALQAVNPRVLTFHHGGRYPSDHFPVEACFFQEPA